MEQTKRIARFPVRANKLRTKTLKKLIGTMQRKFKRAKANLKKSKTMKNKSQMNKKIRILKTKKIANSKNKLMAPTSNNNWREKKQ